MRRVLAPHSLVQGNVRQDSQKPLTGKAEGCPIFSLDQTQPDSL